MSELASRQAVPRGPRKKRSRGASGKSESRRQLAGLKADVRHSRLGPEALLADERVAKLQILTALSMVPYCGLQISLEALLVCQINGARLCGHLSGPERRALATALSQIGQGNAVPPRRGLPSHPEGAERELDRIVRGTRRTAPAVELVPSEFAAARTGLEVDPVLLRMVDRLVDAVRLYAERDDGGARARVVVEQWIRYRNYIPKVASGEYPRPSQRGPAVVE